MIACELRHLAAEHDYGPCGGGMDKHHIISKNDLRKNRPGRALVDKIHPHIFLADVCNYHNAQTKFADLPVARDYLLEIRYNEYLDEFLQAVEDLRLTMKIPLDYLRPYLEMLDEPRD